MASTCLESPGGHQGEPTPSGGGPLTPPKPKALTVHMGTHRIMSTLTHEYCTRCGRTCARRAAPAARLQQWRRVCTPTPTFGRWGPHWTCHKCGRYPPNLHRHACTNDRKRWGSVARARHRSHLEAPAGPVLPAGVQDDSETGLDCRPRRAGGSGGGERAGPSSSPKEGCTEQLQTSTGAATDLIVLLAGSAPPLPPAQAGLVRAP